MNVIITNEAQNELSSIDIDIIKNINGVYSAYELVEMFKTFFYDRMILDVTAIKDYNTVSPYKTLADGLDQEKIILVLPAGSNLCTPNFLTKLISFGIYNFTTNANGVMYLLKKPNTHKDVENIEKMATGEPVEVAQAPTQVVQDTKPKGYLHIVGFRNLTRSSGATSLIYMLKKEVAGTYGNDSVIAIEVNRNDFSYFYDNRMISSVNSELEATLKRFDKMKVILVDLNDCTVDHLCDEIFYLIEPSTFKLNSLMRKNRNIFTQLNGRKILLNQSLLLENDVKDFESESGVQVFFNIPPLDDRKRNDILHDFAIKAGIIPADGTGFDGGKIFGLFRR